MKGCQLAEIRSRNQPRRCYCRFLASHSNADVAYYKICQLNI